MQKRKTRTNGSNGSKEPLFSRNNIPVMLTLGGILLSIGGFYYTTQGKLGDHTKALDQLTEKLEKKKDDDDKARDQLKATINENAAKTAEGISQLSTKAAVQETQTNTMNKQLEKIADQLTRLTVKR